MNTSILLIDDDQRLSLMIKEYLDDFGYMVELAPNGLEGLDMLDRGSFEAVILDLMLPDIGGLEVFRIMSTRHDIPVLMLTAKGDPMDRVVGLELGADDYLGKPFEPRELLARLRTILRRGKRPESDDVKTFGRLEIDKAGMEARLDGERCDLTSYQFQILAVMASAVGRVLSRDQLMNQLQGNDLEAFDRSIDVHISRIRAVIEDEPKKPRRILTVRGIGYTFSRSQD